MWSIKALYLLHRSLLALQGHRRRVSVGKLQRTAAMLDSLHLSLANMDSECRFSLSAPRSVPNHNVNLSLTFRAEEISPPPPPAPLLNQIIVLRLLFLFRKKLSTTSLSCSPCKKRVLRARLRREKSPWEFCDAAAALLVVVLAYSHTTCDGVEGRTSTRMRRG